MKQKKARLELKSNSNPKTRLRIVSGILFILSGIVGYFSRVEVDVSMMSRVAVINKSETMVYYIWDLLAVSILLLIAALAFLALSFKKKNK